MANDYSLVILVAKLTRDPELRYSGGGVPYATLSLAVNRNQTQPDGSVAKSVSCIDATVWRTQAELVTQMCRRGSTVMIVGTLQEQRSTDDQGGTRSHLRVIADRVQFLDRRVEAPTAGEQA